MNEIKKHFNLVADIKQQWRIEQGAIILPAAGVIPKSVRDSPKYLIMKEGISTNIQREAWSILPYLQVHSLKL